MNKRSKEATKWARKESTRIL